jgi:hypothetical protein
VTGRTPTTRLFFVKAVGIQIDILIFRSYDEIGDLAHQVIL